MASHAALQKGKNSLWSGEVWQQLFGRQSSAKEVFQDSRNRTPKMVVSHNRSLSGCATKGTLLTTERPLDVVPR